MNKPTRIIILILISIAMMIIAKAVHSHAVGVSATVPENEYHRCLDQCKLDCYNAIGVDK